MAGRLTLSECEITRVRECGAGRKRITRGTERHGAIVLVMGQDEMLALIDMRSPVGFRDIAGSVS